MNISISHMKEAVYIMMAVMGCLLIISGAFLMQSSGASSDPLSLWLPALIFIFGGILSVVFTFVTFLIRDDPDVWR